MSTESDLTLYELSFERTTNPVLFRQLRVLRKLRELRKKRKEEK